MKKLSGLLIVVLFAMLTVAAWGYANRPTAEPAWPRVIQGFAFQPYQKDQDAIAGDDPTVEQIDADLRLLAGKTRAVRTYSTLGTLGVIPAPGAQARPERHARHLARHRPRAQRARDRGVDPAGEPAPQRHARSWSATKSCCAATCRSRT